MAYHGFPIYSESKDLCDKTDCPVKKGPVTVALEEPFPIITPPVRILLTYTLYHSGAAKAAAKFALACTCKSNHNTVPGPDWCNDGDSCVCRVPTPSGSQRRARAMMRHSCSVWTWTSMWCLREARHSRAVNLKHLEASSGSSS